MKEGRAQQAVPASSIEVEPLRVRVAEEIVMGDVPPIRAGQQESHAIAGAQTADVGVAGLGAGVLTPSTR